MCNIRFGSQGMILNGFKQKKVEIILRAPHHRLDFMIGNLMEDPFEKTARKPQHIIDHHYSCIDDHDYHDDLRS